MSKSTEIRFSIFTAGGTFKFTTLAEIENTLEAKEEYLVENFNMWKSVKNRIIKFKDLQNKTIYLYAGALTGFGDIK